MAKKCKTRGCLNVIHGNAIGHTLEDRKIQLFTNVINIQMTFSDYGEALIGISQVINRKKTEFLY